MNVAIITAVDLADDGVLLVRATHSACGKTVLHGAGRDLDAPVLGHRVSHCCEGGYELTDSAQVIPARIAEIRDELAAKAAHRAEARARRLAAEDVAR